MNILVIHNRYQRAGGEDIVVDQETRLLRRNGHQVSLYERSNDELNTLSPIERVGLITRIVMADDTRLAVRRELRALKPDVVHIHNTFLMISPSVYEVCQEEGVPVVQTLHNYRLLCPAATFYRNGKNCEECVTDSLLRSVRYGCYRESRMMSGALALVLQTHRWRQTWNKKVDAYIAISNFVRDKFVRAGLPAERIHVKPNFVEYDPGRIPRAGDYALFLGRLTPEKGLLTLLEAWTRMPSAVPLVIAGDGPMRQRLEDEIKTKNLGSIHLTGLVNRGEAFNMMKRAAFLVVPSVWYEPFGLVIAEAFACGTPVIGSTTGAVQEMVKDQVTGLQFEAGNPDDLAAKVAWAWNNPNALILMGDNARGAFEEQYGAETNYTRLMTIYDTAINTHASFVPSRIPLAAQL